MASSSTSSQPSPPTALRVGGAFMVVAFVLVLFALISVFTDGWGADFEWTYSKVAIIVAAVIVGAFSTMSKSQAGSRAQVAALVIAIVIIAASRFVPGDVLFAQPQYWSCSTPASRCCAHWFSGAALWRRPSQHRKDKGSANFLCVQQEK